jgi:hypothetical protein
MNVVGTLRYSNCVLPVPITPPPLESNQEQGRSITFFTKVAVSAYSFEKSRAGFS